MEGAVARELAVATLPFPEIGRALAGWSLLGGEFTFLFRLDSSVLIELELTDCAEFTFCPSSLEALTPKLP